MEAIELDGVRYLKARDAARQTGYTADYIGQLCRAGEIDARMVGRSWYVNPEELSAHRTEKKRSVRAKAREQVKKSIAAQSVESEAKHTEKQQASATQYQTDESDLFPTIHRSEEATTRLDNEPETVTEDSASDAGAVAAEDDAVGDTDEATIPIQRSDSSTRPAAPVRSTTPTAPKARAVSMPAHQSRGQVTPAVVQQTSATTRHEQQTAVAAQEVRERFSPSSLRTPAIAVAALVLLACTGILAPMVETRWKYTFEDTPEGTAWTANTAYGLHLETINIR